MKKTASILLLVCLCFAVFQLRAQQLTHWSSFTYNYLQYNPAVTGTTPCLEIRLGYRNQWRGFEGAPRTAFANMHGKIQPKKSKWNFIGVGGAVENDDSGPFSFTTMQVMGAYHVKMAKNYYLSAGMGVGFAQYHVNFGQMSLFQQDIDPVITSSLNNFIFPTISAGLWLYKDDRFYGISARNFNQKSIDGLGDSRLNRHWTLSAGKAIKMSKDVRFKPAVLLNYVGKSKASLEGQFLLEYMERFNIGLGARSGHGISALVKVNAFKYLTFSYAYDLTMNKIRFTSTASHELILGIRACAAKGKYEVDCAAYN